MSLKGGDIHKFIINYTTEVVKYELERHVISVMGEKKLLNSEKLVFCKLQYTP